MVAVAPPELCGASSATAGLAVAIAPATTRPDASETAAVRPAFRLRAARPDRPEIDAENQETTEFPFEQDPLMWGVWSHQQNQKPRELCPAS